MLPSIPRPEDYDVCSFNGFLPSEPPLQVLPDGYYAKWEAVASNLQALLHSGRLRQVVDSLPVLSTNYLKTPAEWRRAYTILAFITHSYIWGGNKPAEVVPPPISIPFTAACEYFELPTVATYAGCALWNYKPLFDDEHIDSLENLSTLLTYTGSIDESWFYLVSVAIEARGAPAIPIMLDAIEAAREGDALRVTADLQTFAEIVAELGDLLQRMCDNCDPHVFYHRIRPFLAGSKNMADAGLPNGVTFDDGSGTAQPVFLSGGSNAQSSLIQFFDIVLGVQHRHPGSSAGSDPEGPAGYRSPPKSFISEMRTYMPGPHRRFLGRVEDVANIREFVVSNVSNKALTTAYDACLAMLRAFRDKHIQIVTRYIIVKSCESRPVVKSSQEKMNIATMKYDGNAQTGKKLKGTGGTALMPFLKQARDETTEPAISSWARRVVVQKLPCPKPKSARLRGVDEHGDVLGLAGIWSVEDNEGGICHY